jgi:predicted nucleic acid-binding protein
MTMNRYLLDTNVLSEVTRKRPNPQVMQRLGSIPASGLFTAAICVTELRYGTSRHPSGARLWNRIVDEILALITVVPLGSKEAQEAGDIYALLEAKGKPIGLADILIAATAKVHNLTVVTRNVKHLERVDGIRVENWWLPLKIVKYKILARWRELYSIMHSNVSSSGRKAQRLPLRILDFY